MAAILHARADSASSTYWGIGGGEYSGLFFIMRVLMMSSICSGLVSAPIHSESRRFRLHMMDSVLSKSCIPNVNGEGVVLSERGI